MRDGTRQFGDHRRAEALADGLVDWMTVDVRPVDDARPAPDPEPDISERITLIEFVWSGLTGSQPVILVSREWLQ